MLIAHPMLGMVCLLAAGLAAGLLAGRATGRAVILVALAGVCLAGAAAGVSIRLSAAGRVVALLDVSPSTRTAAWHADKFEIRLAEALGERVEVRRFGEGATAGTTLPPELLAGADTLLLFSDARLATPRQLPPTLVVLDPALDAPADARLAEVTADADRLLVEAPGRGERPLAVAGQAVEAPGDRVVLPLPDEAVFQVALAGGDAWPENDAVSFSPAETTSARWWVGGPAPAGFKAVPAASLPATAAGWLEPAVVVLANVPAEALSDAQLAGLGAYVADAGGGLVLTGGGAAFAAGGWVGTPLAALSPLAPAPPEPRQHWVFLVDASGSMNNPAGQGSRLTVALDAAGRALAALPPADLVSLGTFDSDLEWLARRQPATAAFDRLPRVRGGGATQLEPALLAAAELAGDDPTLQTQVIVVSDGLAGDASGRQLGRQLADRGVRVHLFEIGSGAERLVRDVVEQTGGRRLNERDPRQWAAGLGRLVRQAQPDYLIDTPARVAFTSELTELAPVMVEPWNQTWPRDRAALQVVDDTGPLAAFWQVGAGRVAALAFDNATAAAAAAQRVARPPIDPRLQVRWGGGGRVAVEVVAAEVAGIGAGRPLNRLAFTLAVGEAAVPLEQTAPGRYAASLPAGPLPAVAQLRLDGAVVSRRAVAGRYPAEFDAIGNDPAAAEMIAQRSGGGVARLGGALSLPGGHRHVSLTQWLAVVGAVLAAASAVAMRRG